MSEKIFKAGWDAAKRDTHAAEDEDIADAPDVAWQEFRRLTPDESCSTCAALQQRVDHLESVMVPEGYEMVSDLVRPALVAIADENDALRAAKASAERDLQDTRHDRDFWKEGHAEAERERDEAREQLAVLGSLSHEFACRLSRVFNAGANLRSSTDAAINEWLKTYIASLSRRPARPEDPQ